jgi:hypothetical protein
MLTKLASASAARLAEVALVRLVRLVNDSPIIVIDAPPVVVGTAENFILAIEDEVDKALASPSPSCGTPQVGVML